MTDPAIGDFYMSISPCRGTSIIELTAANITGAKIPVFHVIRTYPSGRCYETIVGRHTLIDEVTNGLLIQITRTEYLECII